MSPSRPKQTLPLLIALSLLTSPFSTHAQQRLTQNSEAPVLAPLTSHPPSAALTLDSTQGNLLNQIFQGARRGQVGQAQQNLESLNVLDFAVYLEKSMLKDYTSVLVFFEDLEFGPTSAVQGWLLENGYHPLLAYIFESNTRPKTVAYDNNEYLAKRWLAEQGIEEPTAEQVKSTLQELSKISFKVPFGIEMRGNTNALRLSEAGKPVNYDPELLNVLAQLPVLAEKIAESGRVGVQGTRQKFGSHFYSLSKLFISMFSIITEIEELVYNIQGLIDTVRLKLSSSHADKMSERKQLETLLFESLQMKKELARLVGSALSATSFDNDMSLPTISKRLTPIQENLIKLKRHILSRSHQFIQQMDIILGFDGDPIKSLQFDTPWELAFAEAKEERHLYALNSNWNDLSSFEILIHERYNTAHWTTQERRTRNITDKDGRVTGTEVYYETVHHNTSETLYSHETVHAPDYEQRMAQELKQYIDEATRLARYAGADKSVLISNLENKVLEAKSRHAHYAQQPARGKDEDSQRVERIRNQQKLYRAVVSHLRILSVQTEQNLPKFSAKSVASVGASYNVILNNLKAKDRANATRVNWTMGITGTAAAAATCYFVLFGGAL